MQRQRRVRFKEPPCRAGEGICKSEYRKGFDGAPRFRAFRISRKLYQQGFQSGLRRSAQQIYRKSEARIRARTSQYHALHGESDFPSALL